MKRLSATPRPDKAEKLEAIGLSFHDWDQYWKEDAYYEFTAAQIDELEEAAESVHQACLGLVERVVNDSGLLRRLAIPPSFHEAIGLSWNRRDPSLYGRFDFAWDGSGPPQMLEYNADTPTSLLESAVAQWDWQEEMFGGQADQFNSLHEQLVERWKAIVPAGSELHLASLSDNEEDWVCVQYLRETALQAGLHPQHLFLEDLGFDAQARQFVDDRDRPIWHLFKLYPLEWMVREDFGPHLADRAVLERTRLVEPLWKLVLSNKGMLPLLHEFNPQHPNILPAWFDEAPAQAPATVRKPLFSREGANIAILSGGASPQEIARGHDGGYGQEGWIHQAYRPIRTFDGMTPVLGLWMVGDRAAGLCIREDRNPITTNMSHFVPHVFFQTESPCPPAS